MATVFRCAQQEDVALPRLRPPRLQTTPGEEHDVGYMQEEVLHMPTFGFAEAHTQGLVSTKLSVHESNGRTLAPCPTIWRNNLDVQQRL